MKKPVLFIILNFIIILGLSVAQVVAANSISTTGIELGKIQDQTSRLQKENEILKEQVLSLSSFTSIASRAGDMGFEDGKSVLAIPQELPLARK